MGAGLAKAAYAAAARVGAENGPTRVYVYMALLPIDERKDPTYFGGAERLALEALGRDADDRGLRAVGRALAALQALGLIKGKRQGRGKNSRYALLDGCGKPLLTGRLTSGQEDGRPDAQRPVKEIMIGRSAADDRTLSGGWSDAQRPVEEIEEIEEEGDARATFELEAPPTPTPPPWDHDLPEPRTAHEAGRCARHPHGTSDSCFTCGANRRAWEQEHPGGRPKREPKYDCSKGRHRVISEKSPGVPDDICVTCHQAGVVDAYAPAPIGATA